MPVEVGRTTARKVIDLPGGQSVSIPVITKISFIDASGRYQETEHVIDNSSDSNRIVHVDKVHPTSGDISKSIDVERIDFWNVIDPVDRHQETQFHIDNVTGADSAPPHFSTHLRTHVVRYHADPNNPNDNGDWVDSELIDEIAVIDPADRYQESYYTLVNTDLPSDPADPDISDALLDPPYRTDPFQNIVDWHTDVGAEPFYRALAGPVPNFSAPPSGQWQLVGSYYLSQGFAFIAGEIDIRFVDQFFEPHTYDTPEFQPGTGDVKGYTYGEWDTLFSPGRIWFDQLQQWRLDNGFVRPSPDNFDFEFYGFKGYLQNIFQAWLAGPHVADPTVNPIPYVWVRFSVFGPVTTDHPGGRY